MNRTGSDHKTDKRLIEILEKQKQDLVIRFLKKNEEVEAGKDFTNQILSSLSSLFFLLSKELVIVQANKEFYRCLEYSPENNEQLTLEQISGEKNYELIKTAVTEGEFNSLETHLRTRTGKEVPVILKGSTYTSESGRILYMLIASDRTDFQTMMVRMCEAQEQLIHSDRLVSLGEMAAGVSHELTQPLNAILLFARNCIKALDNPLQNKEMLTGNLNIIIDRVNKATSIIRSLQNFGRKVPDEISEVNINTILRNILEFLDSQLRLSDIQLDLQLDETIPRVLGQEVKLEQVCLNLIQNAIQAMGKTEYPVLTVKTRLQKRVAPETLEEKTFVLITIEDNGEGMSKNTQKKIFDPFFSTREVGTGMGLGLSIVDQIVRGFSGFIKVESFPGFGTCFSVLLLPCYNEKREEKEDHETARS
ncbi:MAG: PAS domain-containing protein [Proteobacteria bacterium]|nr:PAS domain-containing protein [Pseudomonadota bacterium]MBU1059190.1 PAS domain-containing protein [Pseudomonadota bacterium]